jgi:hypothetical protein
MEKQFIKQADVMLNEWKNMVRAKVKAKAKAKLSL